MSVTKAVDSTSESISNTTNSKNKIEKIRTLSDGTVVKQIINTNTGKIISVTYTRHLSATIKNMMIPGTSKVLVL